MRTKFEVLIFTETWTSEEEKSLLNINGYNLYIKSNSLNRSDGIVMYVANSISSKKIDSPNEYPFLAVELQTKNNKYLVTSVYRSPSTSIPLFIEQLDNYMNGSCFNFDYSLVIGDVNIDLLCNSKKTHDYLSIMSSHGFESFVNRKTRPASNTCLDHIFSKSKHNDSLKTAVLEMSITDHYATALHASIKKDVCSRSSKPCKFIEVRNVNKEKLLEESALMNWEIDANRSIETLVNEFVNNVKTCISRATVIKKVNLTKKTFETLDVQWNSKVHNYKR